MWCHQCMPNFWSMPWHKVSEQPCVCTLSMSMILCRRHWRNVGIILAAETKKWQMLTIITRCRLSSSVQIIIIIINNSWTIFVVLSSYIKHCERVIKIGQHLSDWIEQGLTSPPTQYRLSGRQFYRSKDPTNSIKVLKERLASHSTEEAQNPPGASQPCYKWTSEKVKPHHSGSSPARQSPTQQAMSEKRWKYEDVFSHETPFIS